MNDYTSMSNTTGSNFLITPMPSVRFEQSEHGWLAHLEPELSTDYEWGWGKSPEEALRDLASTIEEMREHLKAVPNEKLADPLLRYKHFLEKFASVRPKRKGKP